MEQMLSLQLLICQAARSFTLAPEAAAEILQRIIDALADADGEDYTLDCEEIL